MKMRPLHPSGTHRIELPRPSSLLLSAACGVLVLTLGGPKELAASTPSLLGPDYDEDGVADGQEWVLATLPDVQDTDGDGYHDLEEIARRSDPLSPSSMPVSQTLSVGMYAYAEAGRVNLHTAIYVDGGDPTNLRFQLGVVWKDTPLVVAQAVYTPTTKFFFYGSPADPQDKILVLEMPMPDALILQLGALSLYSKIDRLGTAEVSVDVTNLVVDPAAGIVRIEPSPASIQGGKGIVYRPLTAGSTPSTSTAGQICWQRTAVVGSSGASLVYEVEQANCEDFDSSCSSAGCASTVGGTITLPNPGGLLGG
jgi:hypothetical protein